MNIFDAQVILDSIYDKVLEGMPFSLPVDKLANQYLKSAEDTEKAVRNLVDAQVFKCAATGFVTSFGGLMSLPVSVSADIAGVTYVQLRMIAAIAQIYGYSPDDPAVKTLVYMSFTGVSITDIVKSAGIKLTGNALVKFLKKAPQSMMLKINNRIYFRFVSRFSKNSIYKLGKIVPVVSGGIGAGTDALSTRVVAQSAIDNFSGNRPPKNPVSDYKKPPQPVENADIPIFSPQVNTNKED